MPRRGTQSTVIALLAVAAFGQDTESARPAFEVASIKPADPKANGSSTNFRGTQMVMENLSLKDFIERAFFLKDYSLSGPPWLDSARFDIVAKFPIGAPRDQSELMLQTLLAERFKLEYHRESKVLQAFALVVDRKGLKVAPAQDGKPGGGWSMGRGQIAANHLTMSGVADLLARHLNVPVEDRTGVAGMFDFKLRFVPDDAPADAPVDKLAASSIFAALQEQAGLKLESRKLPVQILVVDHIERQPVGN